MPAAAWINERPLIDPGLLHSYPGGNPAKANRVEDVSSCSAHLQVATPRADLKVGATSSKRSVSRALNIAARRPDYFQFPAKYTNATGKQKINRRMNVPQLPRNFFL